MATYGIRRASTPLSSKALRRVVKTIDSGVVIRRVIPVPVLLAIDEQSLVFDAHLTYALRDTGPVVEQQLMGFKARACAYALEVLSPSKRAFVLEHVMTEEDILRWHRELPVTDHERWRARVVDSTQGSVFLPIFDATL